MTFTRNEHGVSSRLERFRRYDEKPSEVVLRDFSGGVSTAQVSGHMFSSLINMESVGRAVSSLSYSQEERISGGFVSGAVTDHCYGEGIWLFRKGKSLYKRENEVITLVGTANMLATTSGAIYYIDGAFYLVDGVDIWRIERDMSYEKLSQSVPICFTDVSVTGKTMTPAAPLNPFSVYMDVVMASSNTYSITYPTSFAFDKNDVVPYADGSDTPLASSKYKNNGTGMTFSGTTAANKRIRFKLVASTDPAKISLNTAAELRGLIASPNAFLPYTAPNGVNYFLSWDQCDIIFIERDGELFSHVSEEIILRIPMDDEITAVIPHVDGYFLFTESSVKKLWFTMDELGAIHAQTSMFKQDFGSDMPNSVCGFDDKIIFANSRGGIFYINKFGITEKDANRKISLNIEEGAQGFFSHTAAEYTAARAVCAFGKYYLTVGEITYIWDYTERLPSVSQSRKDEEGMVWAMSDMFAGAVFLQQVTGRLYFWDGKTGTLRYLTGQRAEGTGATSSFILTASDLGTMKEKTLLHIGLRYRSAASLMVKLVYDGEKVPISYTLPAREEIGMASIRGYHKKFQKLSIEISAQGSFTLDAICFKFI